MADNQPGFIKSIMTFLGPLTKSTDLLLGVAAVVIVLMLIIPLPTIFLDFFLIINLALSLLIILTSIYVKKPAEFSAFPTLILLTTIFSLALNVSSTRLILQLGPAFDGKVIKAFGNFVVGGDYLIGIIIFIIILAIQLLVITKGASRVSEVSARFTLDALPAKQLAINEDLNAGLITQEEAEKRRKEVRMEADFYGAMDGSSKFVSGNVKVAIVILLVDIIGGLITGLVVHNQTLEAAAKTYILFTVGDGIISQIPAILISTATGIIVTRTAAQEKFASDVVTQLGSTPRVLYISGGTIFLMGFVPGFPTVLTSLVGGLLLGIGYLLGSSIKQKETKKQEMAKTKDTGEQMTTMEEIVRVDPMTLEIGYNLVSLVDKEQGGDLLDRIKMIRKRIGLDLGILVPPIRIIDNVGIDASEYLIKIRGTEISRGKVFVNKLLAMNPKNDLSLLDGILVKEPAFGLAAKWISDDQRTKAESLGFDIFDPPSVVATHLTEMIKKNSAELLTRQDVKSMLDALQKEYPAIVDEVLKVSGGIGEIQKVLQSLLREGVQIRNMLTILETIADYAPTVKNIDLLTEYVRQSLGKQIITNYSDDNDSIKGIIIDPELEGVLSESIQERSDGLVSSLEPEILHQFVDEAGKCIENALKNGVQPIVLTSQKTRRLVREMLERSFPSIPVLSYSEIPSRYSLDQVGMISISLYAMAE